MDQGKLQKARRGELRFALPIGYVWDHAGAMALDPDEQVPHVVRLVFRKFDDLGTLHALVRYLVQQGIELGVRRREGPTKGMLEWRCPKRTTLQALLRNPIYAGAYAYGRRQVDGRKKRPGRPSSGRVARAPHEYHVLLHKHVPAYITWEQYEQNLARLAANRAHADTLGAVRHGPALLAGIVVCGTCNHRLQVRYGGSRTLHSYVCGRSVIDYGGDYCQYVAGEPIDTFVTQWVLKALEPAALTLSLEATARLEHERQELTSLWQQRLERAAYESERAARHYRLVEPEHRLVARQLAKDWEDKLTAQRQLQEEYERFLHTQAQALSRAERDAIAAAGAEYSGALACPHHDRRRSQRDDPSDHPARHCAGRRGERTSAHHDRVGRGRHHRWHHDPPDSPHRALELLPAALRTPPATGSRRLQYRQDHGVSGAGGLPLSETGPCLEPTNRD